MTTEEIKSDVEKRTLEFEKRLIDSCKELEFVIYCGNFINQEGEVKSQIKLIDKKIYENGDVEQRASDKKAQ